MAIDLPIVVGGAFLLYGENPKGDERADNGGIEVSAPSARGRVIELSAQQRINRARYLGGELDADGLDPYVRRDGRRFCATIYYRLRGFNGGKDPTAPDPATRWRMPGSDFINITCDCMGAAAWIGGFDRYQPIRFAHIYEGWINTDSMIADAEGAARCFRKLARPEPGCFIVAPTASSAGGPIGHIGCVVSVEGYAPEDPSWWRSVRVVDVAARGDGVRANRFTTATGWAARAPRFIIPTMKA